MSFDLASQLDRSLCEDGFAFKPVSHVLQYQMILLPLHARHLSIPDGSA